MENHSLFLINEVYVELLELIGFFILKCILEEVYLKGFNYILFLSKILLLYDFYGLKSESIS